MLIHEYALTVITKLTIFCDLIWLDSFMRDVYTNHYINSALKKKGQMRENDDKV